VGPAWGGAVYHAGISLPYLSAALALLVTAGVSLLTATRSLPLQVH